MAKKADIKKKPVKSEVVVTDVAREYFTENGVDKVKITYLNGNKVVKKEIMDTKDE